MNQALLFLWAALLRGRALRFLRSLRRPTTCLGVLGVIVLLGVLFYFREHKVVGQVVRKENLIGAGLVMLWGSVFKGLLQRGLVCEAADIEFVFTSPFTSRQILLYRLLPSYCFAIVQSLVFLILFASHLRHPIITAICLALFQMACFHLGTAASVFAGTLSEQTHLRLRWMMAGSFFLLTALYLRLAWNFRPLPAFASSPALQMFFYPVVSVSDIANAGVIHRWAQRAMGAETGLQSFGQAVAWLAGFLVFACISLWWVLRLRTNPFEAALNATYQAVERKERQQQGRVEVGSNATERGSMSLPRLALFRGAGALVWKNWVAVRRARKEMRLTAFFVLTYTGAFTALLWIFHDLEKRAGSAPLEEARGFTTGIALTLGMLAFFLQRMFPFDLRRDGPHLPSFRTLPVSPFAVALAEIAVPTTLCLVAQGCGVIPLVIWGKFDWPTMLLVVLGFPAVALALNSVWNIHYLIDGVKRTSGRGDSSAVGVLMVVALSFLIFYPAGWTTIKVANLFGSGHTQALGFTVAAAAGLVIQYGIDLLLIVAIARLFQSFEFSREG